MSYLTIKNKCKECPFKNKEVYQKYKQIWCTKKHNSTVTNELAENCEIDQRHYCIFCENFEDDNCKIDGHFKDGETLRVCKAYKLNENKRIY